MTTNWIDYRVTELKLKDNPKRALLSWYNRLSRFQRYEVLRHARIENPEDHLDHYVKIDDEIFNQLADGLGIE